MSDELISLIVLSILISFCVISIALLIRGAIYDNRRNKARIVKHIKRQGGAEIQISSQFLDFDRANYTYHVAFTDVHGNRRRGIVKQSALGFLGPKRLYWDGALLAGFKQSQTSAPQPKQAIVDQIVAENNLLRARIWQLEADRYQRKVKRAGVPS